MRKLYWHLISNLHRILVEPLEKVSGWIGLSLFVLLLFNQNLAQKYMNWEGISPRWCWFPIVMVFGHALLREAQKHGMTVRDDLGKLKSQIEELLNEGITHKGKVISGDEMTDWMISAGQWCDRVLRFVKLNCPEKLNFQES